jgi:hypothetical protein
MLIRFPYRDIVSRDFDFFVLFDRSEVPTHTELVCLLLILCFRVAVFRFSSLGVVSQSVAHRQDIFLLVLT